MTKIFITTLVGFMLLLGALPGFCEEGAATVLYQDKETGQLYTKPAEGRVPVDAVKDLKMPESAMGSLYEDENGNVYTKPGAGRKPIAAASQPPATPQASEAGEGGADYSTQAFSDAVRHVVGEEQATTYPKIKMGTLFYGEYNYDFDKRNTTLDNGHHDPRNKFTLNRGYINLRAELTPEVNFRFTPDITRINDSNSKNNGDWALRVKFGYVEFHDFLNFYPSFDVKLGQFETAWLDYEEGLWTYRVLDTMLIEKEGFFNSADLGVGLKGKIPAGYGDWQVDVINGEGYHADEANKYKTVQARLSIVPLPQVDLLKGLQLTGFASTGQQDFLTKRDRYIAFLGYKYQDDLFIAGEYDSTFGADSFIKSANSNLGPGALGTRKNIKGQGFSAMAWYRMPFLKPLRALGRYDYFNHDLDQSHSTVHRWYSGLSYDLNKYVMFSVVNERSIFDANLAASGKGASSNENLLKVDVQVKFN
jgi:hypothetical protein